MSIANTRCSHFLALLCALALSSLFAHDCKAELLHHWRFDETTGTTAADSVGNLDLTLNNFAAGDAHWVAGEFGGGLRFDGVDDFGTNTIGSGPNEIGGGMGTSSAVDLTVSVWAHHDDLSGNQRYLGWGGDGTSGFRRFYFGWTDSGDQISSAFGADTGNAPVAEDPSAEFVNYTSVWDASTQTVSVYENGNLIGSEMLTVPAEAAYAVDNMLSFNVGKNYNGATAFFGGVLDDLAIWDEALTGDQIQEIVRSGVAPAAVPEPGSILIWSLASLLSVCVVRLVRRRS